MDKSVDCVYTGIRGVVHCAIKTVDKNIFRKNDVWKTPVVQAFVPAYTSLTEY